VRDTETYHAWHAHSQTIALHSCLDVIDASHILCRVGMCVRILVVYSLNDRGGQDQTLERKGNSSHRKLSTNNETLQDGYGEALTRPARLKNVSVVCYIGYIRVGGLILRIRAGFVRFFDRSYV